MAACAGLNAVEICTPIRVEDGVVNSIQQHVADGALRLQIATFSASIQQHVVVFGLSIWPGAGFVKIVQFLQQQQQHM